MKFDQNYIVIRRRNGLEILDLSLQVMRDHFFPLMVLGLIGCLPWALINCGLIGWMIRFDSDLGMLYWWTMLLLVTSQAQFGSIFVTKYLGDAIFVGKPKISEAIRQTVRQTPRLFIPHFVARLEILILLVSLIFLGQDEVTSLQVAGLLLPLLVLVAGVVKIARPFVNEILILERTPIRSRNRDVVTFRERNRSLHTVANSNHSGRSLLAVLLAVPIYVACLAFLHYGTAMVTFGYDSTFFLRGVCVPAAMWMTATFLAVNRFLVYIDTRVLQEGWDVELKIRAEAIKLKERVTA